MELNARIAAIAGRLAPRLAHLRKVLHQHPELAFEEHETARAVADFLQGLGLPVSTNMPNEVLELMALYPQPMRAQGSGGVEYLPWPRRKRTGPSN